MTVNFGNQIFPDKANFVKREDYAEEISMVTNTFCWLKSFICRLKSIVPTKVFVVKDGNADQKEFVGKS